MANSTQQFAINASSASAVVAPADQNRRYALISNYSDSTEIMWVAFGKAATCGTAGELEVLAGYSREFGVSRLISANGLVANNETFQQPNCPLESINVICGTRGSPTGTAVGSLMVVSP